MGRDQLLEPRQEVVVVVLVLLGRQEQEPGDRERGHSGLTDARAQGHGLLGTDAQGDVVSPRPVPEAEPLQAVGHRGGGAHLPRAREREGVELLLPVVVPELERGVAEVPQHVTVVDGRTDLEGDVERIRCASPVRVRDQGHRHQHLPQAACPRGGVRGGRRQELSVCSGVPLSAPKVRITAAATPMSRARTGSAGRTACAAFTNMRCASGAEPMLTSMCPRNRATSHSRSGSSVPSRRPEQVLCARRLSACPGAAGRGEAQVGASCAVGGQLRRPLVGRQRRDVATAALRALPHTLEGVDQVGVRPLGGVGAVPDLAVLVPRPGQRLGQRPVSSPAVRPGGGLVDRRAHQRVSQGHRAAGVHQQPGVDRVLQHVVVQSPSRARTTEHVGLTGVVGRGEQQQALHRGRQSAAAVQQSLLDPGGEVERRRQRGRALELGCRELAGQLQEGQRVAACLRDEPLGDLVCGVTAQPGRQEGAGFLGVEPSEGQLGQAGRLEGRRCAVTGREHHCHPVRSEPSGAEQQRSRAGGVQPVCVVDDAQHEALLGSRRQQRERGHPHQEGLDSGTVILPERDREGTCLRKRKLLAQTDERAQQSVQCGEGERRLDLETLGASTVAPSSSATIASSNADLPTPGSPRTTTLPAVPWRASSTSAARSARSGPRPTSTCRTYTLTSLSIPCNPAF